MIENYSPTTFCLLQKFPSKYAAGKNSQDAGVAETSHMAGHNLVDLGAGFASYSRGHRSRGQGRGRSRGGRSQGRVINSRSQSRKKVAATSRRLGQVLRWTVKPRGRGGHRRACRSIRSSRQKPAAKVHEISGERDAPREEPAGDFVREETNEADTLGFQMEAAENVSSSGRSDYEEDNYQITGDEYDYLMGNNEDGYGGGVSGKSPIVDGSDYNVEDEDEDEDDGQVDVNVEDFINGDSDIGENGEDAELNMDPDGLNSTSSEYSD